MATEAFMKPVVPNGHDGYDDDDELSLVFKRNSVTSSTSNRLKPNEAHRKSTIGSTMFPPSMKSPSSVHCWTVRDDRSVVAKERNSLGKAPSVSNSDDEDDKPLSSRFKVNTKKKDLDEIVPLSSSTKHVNNEPKRPLVKNINRNGVKPKIEEASSQTPAKRPHEKGSSPNRCSTKKPKKMSEPAKAVKVEQGSHNAATSKPLRANQVTVKEYNSDDDDVPIASRKRPESSNNKPSSSKLNAIASSSRKIAKKGNKRVKDSNYAKSSESLPCGDGKKKWTTLEHNGVMFPPPYKHHGVKILYQGKPVDLTPEQEEVATMFAVMAETKYYHNPVLRENFWNDWRKLLGRNHVIKNLDDCDFSPIYEWRMREKETEKNMSKEEKRILKEEKLKQEEKYMWAVLDGVRDNTVTWLAFWNDPINPKSFKHVFFDASSGLKGKSDKKKYEKARKLHDHIKSIRAAYTKDFSNKDVTKRQIAVATYLIDKLALRAGNEKDDDEADTVGCCTLKVGNVERIPSNKLKFDFLGKDSIQYVNTVEVEPPVYKAIGEFQADTSILNAHLKELMPGLTAKVFRTYNASFTLDVMLSKETRDGGVPGKIMVYQQANKEVAIICNHQRTVSKSHGAQIEKLAAKLEELKGQIKELNIDLDRAKKGGTPVMGSDGKRKRNLTPEALEKKITQTNGKVEKMERDMQTKEDMKTVALGTSKINYMDPRITVSWCKRHDVPIEKMFNKSLLAKFAWAMDVEPAFRFC